MSGSHSHTCIHARRVWFASTALPPPPFSLPVLCRRWKEKEEEGVREWRAEEEKKIKRRKGVVERQAKAIFKPDRRCVRARAPRGATAVL